MDDNQAKNSKLQIEVVGSPDKTIPKFATNINFNKLQNGDIIMTFVVRYNNNTPAALIETIMVDESHAKKMLEVLDGVIKNKK